MVNEIEPINYSRHYCSGSRVGEEVTLDAGIFAKYVYAQKMWEHKFDTYEIGVYLNEPEHVIVRWIWHWREQVRIERG